jgi:RND family efflux transporter MFP subunit
MKTKQIILTLLAISLFTIGGYWVGSQTGSTSENPEMTASMPDMKDQGKSTNQKKAKANDDREILYWQAPMNPSEIYDKPGKSRMGMDLVPVYADEANSSEGSVSINPTVVQNMNVRTAKVQQVDLSTTVQAVGRVTYDEQRLYNVNPKISGWVEKLYVDYTGKMVRKGQPLFSIYSPELVTTQKEYLLALNTRDKVQGSNFDRIRESGNRLLEASRKRLDYWDIPESEIQRLEETGEIQKAITLKAPASGVVLHKNTVEGEFMKAGAPAYKIADLSKVWVQTSVYDYEVPWIKEGQPASMELSYQPGTVYRGTVSYIYPELEEKTRTVKVRLEFDNPELTLKPGMYADVRIQTQPKPNTTVVPNEAIIRTGDRNVVFLATGDGHFEPREVVLGMEGGDRNNLIEIQNGLRPGDDVVTSAQFLLDSESRLQEAIQKMLNQKKKPAQDMENMDMSKPMDTNTEMKADSSGSMQM